MISKHNKFRTLQHESVKNVLEITFLIRQCLHRLQSLHSRGFREDFEDHSLFLQELPKGIGECKCIAAQSAPSKPVLCAFRRQFQKCPPLRIFLWTVKEIIFVNCHKPFKIIKKFKIDVHLMLKRTCKILSNAMKVPDLPTPAEQ